MHGILGRKAFTDGLSSICSSVHLCPVDNSVHNLIFLMVRRPNPSMRGTVCLSPPPIYNKWPRSVARNCPCGGRSVRLAVRGKFLNEFKSIDIDYAALESECVRAGCSTEDQSSLRSVCKVFAAYRNSCQRKFDSKYWTQNIMDVRTTPDRPGPPLFRSGPDVDGEYSRLESFERQSYSFSWARCYICLLWLKPVVRFTLKWPSIQQFGNRKM